MQGAVQTTPTWCRPMSLKSQLEATRIAHEVTAEPAPFAAIRKSLGKLKEAGIVAAAVQAGDVAPLFKLADRRGAAVALSSLLRDGPAVVSFFRGEWCPFCTLELQALATAYPEIERLGAKLIAVSSHIPDAYTAPGADVALPFPILHDPGYEVASLYGLTFSIPRELRSAYLAIGYPKPAGNRRKDWLLPLPATYVIDTSRRVVLSYLDTDHTTRLEPADLVAALTRLRAPTAANPSATLVQG